MSDIDLKPRKPRSCAFAHAPAARSHGGRRIRTPSEGGLNPTSSVGFSRHDKLVSHGSLRFIQPRRRLRTRCVIASELGSSSLDDTGDTENNVPGGSDSGFVSDEVKQDLSQACVELLSTGVLSVAAYGAPAASGAVCCAAAVGALVFACGTQMNPAVSAALVVTRVISARAFAFNVAAQLSGVTLGAAFVRKVLGISLSKPGLLAESIGRTMSLETVASALLMSVIYNTVARASSPTTAAIGGPVAVTLAVFTVATLNACCNPALAFGKALGVAHGMTAQWIFWLGPIVGCVVAALACEHVIAAPRDARAPVGWLAEWVNECRRNGMSLQRMGVAGLIAYGVLNTLYYSIAFTAIWLRFSSRGGQLLEKIGKVWAVTWAGSQITKPIRLGISIALVPLVNRILVKFGRRSENEVIEDDQNIAELDENA